MAGQPWLVSLRLLVLMPQLVKSFLESFKWRSIHLNPINNFFKIFWKKQKVLNGLIKNFFFELLFSLITIKYGVLYSIIDFYLRGCFLAQNYLYENSNLCWFNFHLFLSRKKYQDFYLWYQFWWDKKATFKVMFDGMS